MYADSDGGLCVGRIAQTLWGPAIGWVSSGSGSSRCLMECSDPHYKQREDGLVYEDGALQLDAVVLLRLHLPPFFGEGAIYSPSTLRKRGLVAQLGLEIPCAVNGSACMCYVNSVELTNVVESEVEDGDFIWCLHASPDMGREIEILSVASPSLASVEEHADPVMLAAPQGLIGSAHYCQRS